MAPLPRRRPSPFPDAPSVFLAGAGGEEPLGEEVPACLAAAEAGNTRRARRANRADICAFARQAGEITDEGGVDRRAVRERCADHVALLTADPCPPQAVVRS